MGKNDNTIFYWNYAWAIIGAISYLCLTNYALFIYCLLLIYYIYCWQQTDNELFNIKQKLKDLEDNNKLNDTKTDSCLGRYINRANANRFNSNSVQQPFNPKF